MKTSTLFRAHYKAILLSDKEVRRSNMNIPAEKKLEHTCKALHYTLLSQDIYQRILARLEARDD